MLLIARRWHVPEFALVVGAVAALIPYIELRDVVDNVGLPRQDLILRLERLIGLGVTPSERLQDLFYSAGGLSPFDHFWLSIYASWMPVAIALVAYLVFARRDLVRPFAVAWPAFFYLAVPVLMLLPTEPPWMATDVVRLLELKIGETVMLDGNAVAAFPSLHVGLPSMLALWSRAAGLRITSRIFTIHAALTAVAVVYLGEHYLLDAVAGLLFAVMIVKLALRFGPALPQATLEPMRPIEVETAHEHEHEQERAA